MNRSTAIKYSYAPYSQNILVSKDGGDIWNNLARSIEQTFTIQGLSFASKTRGMVVGWGYIYGTVDAGATWKQLRSNNADEFLDIVCLDSTTSIAVGRRNQQQALAVRTTNGGDTWQVQTFGAYTSLNGAAFPHPDTGYAIANGAVLKTVNRGQSWTALRSSFSNANLSNAEVKITLHLLIYFVI